MIHRMSQQHSSLSAYNLSKSLECVVFLNNPELWNEHDIDTQIYIIIEDLVRINVRNFENDSSS